MIRMKTIITMKSSRGDVIEVMGYKQRKESKWHGEKGSILAAWLPSKWGQNSAFVGAITYLFVCRLVAKLIAYSFKHCCMPSKQYNSSQLWSAMAKRFNQSKVVEKCTSPAFPPRTTNTSFFPDRNEDWPAQDTRREGRRHLLQGL